MSTIPIFFNNSVSVLLDTEILHNTAELYYLTISSPYPITMSQLVGSVLERTLSGSTLLSNLSGSSQTGLPIAQHR